MRKLFTSKQEAMLISAYYYMKHYEEYLIKMFNDGKLNLTEYNNLSSDIKHAMEYLSAFIVVKSQRYLPRRIDIRYD